MRGVGDVSVVGCVGSLIVATRGVAGAGEVLLNVRGSKEAYLAWSDQPLPRGTEVLVIDIPRSPTSGSRRLSAPVSPAIPNRSTRTFACARLCRGDAPSHRCRDAAISRSTYSGGGLATK